MDGGVIAAQEEAYKQEMMQQVLSPMFFQLKVALGTNMLNFGEPPISDFGGKMLTIVPNQGKGLSFAIPICQKGKYCFKRPKMQNKH